MKHIFKFLRCLKCQIFLIIFLLISLAFESLFEPKLFQQASRAPTVMDAWNERPRYGHLGSLNPFSSHWSTAAHMYTHDSESVWIEKPSILGIWKYQRTDFLKGSESNIRKSLFTPRATTFVVFLLLCSLAISNYIKRIKHE